MQIDAVIFDFGMVLTGQPDAVAYSEMVRLTGLDVAEFDRRYWINRHAYDEGKIGGVRFWELYFEEAGIAADAALIHKINATDARYWTTANQPLVAWIGQLKQAGIKTAVLSNMGDSVHESIHAAFDWLNDLDVQVWSYLLGFAKPDPAIYRVALERLGVSPERALFLDDKAENIAAAQALGIHALQFTTVEDLLVQLKAAGSGLPLPTL